MDVPICNCVFSHGVVAAGSYYNHLLAGVTGFNWELVLLGISLMAGLVGISGIDTITRPTKKHVFLFFFSMFVCFIGFTCKCLRQFFVFIYDIPETHGPMVGSCFDWLGLL